MVVQHALSGARGGAAGHAAFDLAAGLERVMGNRGLFLRVLERFANDYRDLAARLHAALDAGDAVLAQRIAHTLKGAAGMIEAGRLRALALEVELALKAGGATPAVPEQAIAALDAELARVLGEVDALLADAEPDPNTPVPDAQPADAAQPCAPDLARLRAMLDIGDGRAAELLGRMRPQLLTLLGSERMAALDGALKRFDFESALALLEG